MQRVRKSGKRKGDIERANQRQGEDIRAEGEKWGKRIGRQVRRIAPLIARGGTRKKIRGSGPHRARERYLYRK